MCLNTVLIVDDNPTNLRILEILLNKQGYKVVAFTDCRECLEWYRRHGDSLDLAILDYEMTERNGDVLARDLRQAGYQGNCLILTALGSLDRAALIEGSRIHAILNKPINLSDVVYLTKRWASGGGEEDARSESRQNHPAQRDQEIFLFQDGAYHALKVDELNCSSQGRGYELKEGVAPLPGTEIVLNDGQNFSIRWVKPFNATYRFGVCRIEPLH